MDEKEIIYDDISLVEGQDEVTVEEVMPVIEIMEIDGYDIEMQEAFPASTGDLSLNHALLNNREIRDAHPITAITGLREELDSIEALQTVYSDKKGSADYYEWSEGRAMAGNGVGYFVSLNNDNQTITICNGGDIFGVIVDNAAFVGGQDDIVRDAHYGLVATSGLVHVRCELDVAEGDYVVSNRYGIAKISKSGRGYKVMALHAIKGTAYATIRLGISADQIDSMGAELQSLDSRLDAAEANILSAVNTAHDAYKKASDVEASNKTMSDKVDGAVGTVDKLEGDMEGFGEIISNSALISAQAKAIAESAATSAIAMKNEAVEAAKQALADGEQLRKDFENKTVEIENRLDNVADELDDAKESLDQTKNDLQDSIDDAVEKLEDLEEDLRPLATWPDGAGVDRAKSFAGFVTRADESSALLATMVGCDFDKGETLAGFTQAATDTHALVSGVASYQPKDENGDIIKDADGNDIPPSVAGFIAQVDANTANIQSIASKGGSLAGLQAQADGNSASITTLASQAIGDYEIVETWDETKAETSDIYYVKDTKDYYYHKDGRWIATKDITEAGLDGAIAGVKNTADANRAELDAVASYTGTDEDGNSVSGLAGLAAHVDANTAEISELAQLSFTDDKGQTVTGAAGVVAQVNKNTTELSMVAERSFTNADGTQVKGLAALDAQVDENGTNISLVANRVAGKYIIIPELITQDKDNSKIYASKAGENRRYTYWRSGAGWLTTSSWDSLVMSNVVNTNNVYYIVIDKVYRYYEADEWKETDDAYVAGLPASIAGIQVETDENSTRINSLVSWQGDTNTAMARIEQKADKNGAYIQSTVSNMDKYAVGPHSQADGFTLEQASSILKKGMIYVPTKNITEEYPYATSAAGQFDWANLDTNDKTKVYYDYNEQEKLYYLYYEQNEWKKVDKIPIATRSFTRKYLYMWDNVQGSELPRWVTVDKNYLATSETNISSQAVYFTDTTPSVGDNYGYWYAEPVQGETIYETFKDADDLPGKRVSVKYKPYTLYKWEQYTYEDGDNEEGEDSELDYHWIAVATLAGNSQSRAVSQIRQDANNIEAEIVDAYGNVAGFGAKLSATESTVQTLTSWKNGASESIATIQNQANANGANVAQIAANVGGYEIWNGTNIRAPGKVYYLESTQTYSYYDNTNSQWVDTQDPFEAGVVINAASIVTAVNNSGSSVVIKANHLQLNGITSFVKSVQQDVICDTKVEYALSKSSSKFEGVDDAAGEWSTVAPEWRAGAYMWQRTVVIKFTGDYAVVGTWNTEDQDDKDTHTVYYAIEGGKYWYYEDLKWHSTTHPESINNLVETTYSAPTCIHGATGRGTSGVTNYYYATQTDKDTLPNPSHSDWKTKVSDTSFGQTYKYLWNYEVISYDDNTNDSTEPCIIGVYSKDGKGITSIVEYYLLTATNETPTSLPTSTNANGWTKDNGQTAIPKTTSDKPYLWNYEIIDYTEGNDSTSGPVLIGTYGNSIKTTTVTYGVSTSATIKPTSWKTTLPTVPEGSYLWTCTVTDYIDSSVSDTAVYTYAKQGKTPIKGTDYKDGESVTVSSIQYQAGASATTAPTGTWSNTVVSVSEGQYLWSKTTFSDKNVVYGVAKQGSSGKGIKSVVNYYLATNTSSGVTTSTSGWTSSIQSVSSSKKYLWNYETIKYTDNTTSTTNPCIIGAYGDEGKGISSVVEYYQVSTSNTTKPTAWVKDTPPTLTATNKYLWNYEEINYTDKSSTTTAACVIGVYGDPGTPGVNAPKVVSEKKQFYLSTSNTSCAGGSWADSPSGFQYDKTKYLWTRTVYTMDKGDPIIGAASLDKTFTTISNWCSATNQTLIDGANIATGTVTADKLTVLDANNKLVFQADAGAKTVKMAGWTVDSNSIGTGGAVGSSESLYLCSTGTDAAASIGGSTNTTNGWCITASNKFGVRKNGDLYASNVFINGGTISIKNPQNASQMFRVDSDGTLFSNRGRIADWIITSDSIYKTNESGSSSGMCSTAEAATEGLQFTSNSSGYTVTGYTGTSPAVYIPWKYNNFPVTSIGSRAFYGCKNLVSVTIPKNVTSIGVEAFTACSSLAYVNIPTGVTSIGDRAFQSTSLSKGVIFIPSTVTTIGLNAFGNIAGLTIHCEAASKPAGWHGGWLSAMTVDTSSATIEWGCTRNVYKSLIANDAVSKPRFWAGSSSDIPRTSDDAKFLVLADGSLYAQGASINGAITATRGSIGGLRIDNGVKGYQGNVETFSLTSKGLNLNEASASIKVGNFETYHDSATSKTYWRANGPLYIQGIENNQVVTSIELMTDTKGDQPTKSANIAIEKVTYANSGLASVSIDCRFASDAALYTTVTKTVHYQFGHRVLGVTSWDDMQTESFTLPGGQTKGATITLRPKQDRAFNRIRFGYTSDLTSSVDHYIPDTISQSLYKVTQTAKKESIMIQGNIVPTMSAPVGGGAGYSLGDGSHYWNAIYCRTSAIDLSDEDEKNTIQPLTHVHEQIFDALQPVSYKFNVNDNNRTHTGIIAQNVKEAVENAGLTTHDFAAYCEWEKSDGSIGCGLRYSEFIALCIDQIQKLKKRVAELETRQTD